MIIFNSKFKHIKIKKKFQHRSKLSMSSPNENSYNISNVFYLNLDKNTDRAKHMEKLLNSMGLDKHRRFRGVDGQFIFFNPNASQYLSSFHNIEKIPFNFKEIQSLSDSEKRQITGRLGVWLSYLLLMHEIAELRSHEPILILEDDVDLSISFTQTLTTRINQIETADWDLALCGHCCTSRVPKRGVWFKVKRFGALHCFVLKNSKTAEKIAVRLNKPSRDVPIDTMLSYMAFAKLIKIYAMVEQIAVQRRDKFKSDIPLSGSIELSRLNDSFLEEFTQF